MPIFRRKSSRSGKEGDEEPGVPELDVLKLPGNRSLVSLAGPHRYGTGFETTAEAGPGKDIANAGEMSGANTLPRAQPSKGGRTPITPPMTPPTVNQEREGAQKTQSPLVPAYHRPWTKELAASKMGEGGPQPSLQQKEAPQDDQPRLASPSKRNAGPPPSAYAMHKSTLSTASSSSGLYSVMGLPLDFRVSPNLQPQQSPSQRKSMVDAARKMSLKRSKAPSELNIMVVGGRATGKTSWIRTLLSTCDLSVCSEEARLGEKVFIRFASESQLTVLRRRQPPLPLVCRRMRIIARGKQRHRHRYAHGRSIFSTASNCRAGPFFLFKRLSLADNQHRVGRASVGRRQSCLLRAQARAQNSMSPSATLLATISALKTNSRQNERRLRYSDTSRASSTAPSSKSPRCRGRRVATTMSISFSTLLIPSTSLKGRLRDEPIGKGCVSSDCKEGSAARARLQPTPRQQRGLLTSLVHEARPQPERRIWLQSARGRRLHPPMRSALQLNGPSPCRGATRTPPRASATLVRRRWRF